jgi:hypothetical protein
MFLFQTEQWMAKRRKRKRKKDYSNCARKSIKRRITTTTTTNLNLIDIIWKILKQKSKNLSF